MSVEFSNKWSLLILGLLVIAGAGVRLWNLDGTSLWLDEILQLRCTTQGPGAVWECSPANKPPLDYYIQSIIAGQQPSEWRARIHAWAFGVGFLIMMGTLAWRMAGPGFAVAALLAIVLSPVHIRFSQEGRPYSLLLLTEAVFLAALWNICRERRWEKWTAWLGLTAASSLAVWAFYMNLIAMGAALICLVMLTCASKPSRAVWGEALKNKRVLIYCGASIFVLILVCLPLMQRVSDRFDSAQRIHWQGFSVMRAANFLNIYACGYDWFMNRSGSAWIAAVYCGVGVVGGLWRRDTRRSTLVILLFFIGTFGGSLAAYAAMDQFIEMRYTLIALLPFSLLVAMGFWITGDAAGKFLARWFNLSRPNALLTFGMCILAAAPWLMLHGHYLSSNWVPRTDWRGLAERYKGEHQQNSIVYVGDYLDEIALGYYFEKFQISTPIRITDYNSSQVAEMVQTGRWDVWLVLREKSAPIEFWNSLPVVTPESYFLLDVRRYSGREGGAP